MQNSIKQGNAIQAVYTMRPPFTSMHLHFLAALCCFPKIGESASKPWRVLFFLAGSIASLPLNMDVHVAVADTRRLEDAETDGES